MDEADGQGAPAGAPDAPGGPRAADSTDGTDADSGLRRRQLLGAGAALGAGGALAWGLGARTGDGTERITYALARDDPRGGPLRKRTKTVPAQWYRNMQLAFEARAAIRDAGLSALVGAFVVPGSFADPTASLSVAATEAGVERELADLTGDLPVDLDVVDALTGDSERAFDPSTAYQVRDLDRDAVPGGVLCRSRRKYGTLGPAVFDARRGARRFATSNHLFGAGGAGGGTDGGEGTPATDEADGAAADDQLRVVHDGAPVRVGSVDRHHPTADVATVTPAEGFRPSTTIARASGRRVAGQYTKLGLADLAARDEPLVKLGALSDRTTGRVEGVDGYTCYAGRICKAGQLKWGGESTVVDGDSGSVNFHADPERPDEAVLVGGINNARTWWPGADFAWGTAAHHLLDAYGLHF